MEVSQWVGVALIVLLAIGFFTVVIGAMLEDYVDGLIRALVVVACLGAFAFAAALTIGYVRF